MHLILLRFLKRFSFSFDSCTSSSSALLQISLPKEQLKTLEASTTFDFSVSVCKSNLFRVVGLLECLHGWRCYISFREGLWFTFFRFYPCWAVKSLGEISFFFREFFPFFLFYFCFMDLKLTPSSTPLFYLPVGRQEVTKRFRLVKLGEEGVPLRKRLLKEV